MDEDLAIRTHLNRLCLYEFKKFVVPFRKSNDKELTKRECIYYLKLLDTLKEKNKATFSTVSTKFEKTCDYLINIYSNKIKDFDSYVVTRHSCPSLLLPWAQGVYCT